MLLILPIFFLWAPTLITGQANPAFNNPAFNDPDNINARTNQFYFDKHSDCSGARRELYNAEATIWGSDISTTRLGPKSCTIILVGESQFEGTQLDIEVQDMNIGSCGTQVSIYDGDGPQVLLMTFDCRSSLNQNLRRFVTTGNTATFVMTRENTENIDYVVQIKVKPLRGGTEPGWENNYGRDNPFAFDKFNQDAIVGMVGGFYLLVLLICIGVIIYFWRTFYGLNKEWETHQLATLKTGSVFGPTSQAGAPTSRAWSVDLGASHGRSAGPHSTYSRKHTGPPSDDGDSEERFQARRLVTEEKGGARPRYAASNASYSEREDNPDHFEEKVITSRSRAINSRNNNNKRGKRPPSYDDAVSDAVSERTSGEESSDGSVGKKSLASSSSRRTRSSRSRSDTASQSESESEEDSDARSGSSASSTHRRRGKYTRDRERGAKAKRPPPSKLSGRPRGRRESSDGESTATGHSRTKQRPPPQHQLQQYPPPPMAVSYGAPPGQFVPMMAPPIHMVPGFPPQPPPHYPQDQRQQPQPARQPDVQTTDPPVYSYLVRRGYTPLDQRSAVSQHSSQDSARPPEEPDTRLSSGVDYMRR